MHNLFAPKGALRPLRWYQEDAIPKFRDALRQGFKRPIGQAPCGWGKTVLAAHLLDSALKKGSRCLFACPRISLVEQTLAAFESQGIHDIGIMQGNHRRTDRRARIQIACFDTLYSRPVPEFDLTIIDECFPAGTMISTEFGKLPIESIKAGDMVMNATGKGHVLSLFRSSHNTFVKVRLSDGTDFRCTKEHPIFTSSGWREAGRLAIGQRVFREEDMLNLWQGICSYDEQNWKTCGNSNSRSEIQKTDMLQQVLLQEAEKPDARSDYTAESICVTQGKRISSLGPRRKRKAYAGDSESGIGSSGRRMGNRVRSAYKEKASRRVSTLLQAGLGKSFREDRDRVGWRKPLLDDPKGARSEEGCTVAVPWVESIEIEEQSCAEPIYNLRVSGHPSYFANGVLVHNCHMCDARMWKLLPLWKVVLGLTATPWTKGLGLHFDKLLLFSTIEEMIGYNAIDPKVGLVPTIGKGPNWALLNGLSGIKKSDDGEFAETAAAIFMDRNEIVADVVDTWLKTRQDGSHPGDRTFLFCPKRANALALQEAFAAQGIKFGYIDAMTSERTPILKQFRSKEIAGIASVGCLSVGVDEDVRCVIDAALSNSPAAIVQKLMRGSRPGEGKKYLWLNDHTGNSNRFGWFEHIVHDTLDDTPPHMPGGPYQKEDAAPRKEQRRECSSCRSILPRGAMRCNVCGLQLVFDDVEVIPGELTDLKKGPKKEPKPKKDDKQAFYSGLIDFGMRRGFKEGWAANQYRAKFGVWPRGLEAVPMTPRKAVKDFIAESRKKYLEQKVQA